MRLRKLKDVLDTPADAEVDENKNAEVFAEVIQFLDDKSLSLVMRNAIDDGKRALEIMKQHYAGMGKPRVIATDIELTSVTKQINESVTDYIIRAETVAFALEQAGKDMSNGLLITMILKVCQVTSLLLWWLH